MIVKRLATPRASRLRLAVGRRWRWLLACSALAALVGGATLWGVYYGMYLYKIKVATSLADLVDDVIETRLSMVPNFLAGHLFADAERLTIDIGHTDFQKLAYKREIALERGILLTSSEDFVPAEIRYGGSTTRVKLRLKGD